MNMAKMHSKISRKDALKKMGGLALGLPLGSSLVSSVLSQHFSAADLPHIITRKRPNKPNLLFITLEGVPLRALSCYGSRIMNTPNIDRIANEGMLFNNSFCNNALCAPSRATLLTGKYNHLCGMTSNGYKAGSGQSHAFFDPTQQTFPRLLKEAGYNTGMAGKWHLKKGLGRPVNPGDVGYDFFVFKKGAGGPYYNEKGFIQNPSIGSKEMQHKSYPGYITDTFTDLAIDGMEELKEPFCMNIQFFSDHRPFDPPHKYEHIYDNAYFPEPGTFWDDYRCRSSAARKAHMRIADMKDFDPPDGFSERQLKQWNYQQLIRHFLGTLKALDDNVGRLLLYLDNTGKANNTIVVITADHGFFLGEHGWFDKRFMYEESLRVPWLVRYPGMIKPGTKSNAWVQSIDNAPTILDMLGVSIPEDIQGRSLMPVFEGNQSEDWPKSMYYHYYEFGYPHWVLPNYGIRTERYKLISYYTINEWELFDLVRDADEMESLFYEGGIKVMPGYEGILKKLLQQLKDMRNDYKDNTGKPVKFWSRKSYN